MYNFVAEVSPDSSLPVFADIVAASGTLTASPGTVTIRNNAGTVVVSEAVTGQASVNAQTIRLWEIVNTVAHSMGAGCYTVEFAVNATAADGIVRGETPNGVLYIPGDVVRSIPPTAADLQVMLVGANVLPAVLNASQLRYVNLHSAVAASLKNFESAVGRRMIARSETRTFDPPKNSKGVLDLRADLASLTSLVANGAALVNNTDFWLGPDNADADGQPWGWVEFNQPFSAWHWARRSISVTGLWGYGVTMPEDAWSAILAGAAYMCVPQLALAISKGLLRRKEGDVEKDFGRGPGTAPLSEERGLWREQADAGATQYRRVTVGL